ncbi:MAG: hypothetical protein HFG61_01110 [Lachnospiraceae bacterium]|nr:hypothetical protein [Lachnospiraceae bacterium]
MDIYISDKNKKEEVWKLRKYWEEKWFPAIKASLYNFCADTNGQIVNAELGESLIEFYVGNLQYPPIDDILYRQSLVVINKAGIFWRNRVLDSIIISSFSELISFFDKSENQEKYILEDERGNVYSLNELSSKLNVY